MTTPRRDFLGWAGAGAAAVLGAVPATLHATSSRSPQRAPVSRSVDWDMTWVNRITGAHKVVFDAPNPEHGLPVVRANAVGAQYAEVFGSPITEISRVLVLRHKAIIFAMNDAFWSRFKIGDDAGIKAANGAGVDYNPVRVPNAAMPAPFRELMLEPFQRSGGQVLACNLALQFVVAPHYAATGMAADAAYAAAKADLLPGIILQPSGVFAVGVAQGAGCAYIPASAND